MDINRTLEHRRVLFVAHSSGLYGAERSLLDVVAGLRVRGWQPLVVVPANGDITDALEKLKIPYIVQLHKAWVGHQPRMLRIPYRLLINTWAWWRLSRKLSGHFDLVYTNTLTKPLGALLASTWNLPHVWHVREIIEDGLGENYDFGKSRSHKWVASHSATVICNSQAVHNVLASHVPAEMLQVIYNGLLKESAPSVDSRVGLQTSKRPLVLCMVGHLSEHKGHKDAIAALSRLCSEGMNVQLEIAGDGPREYRQEMERLADAHGVGERIKFLGYQKDVTAIFCRADIHLICTRCEAFGRVAVESMALGVPVVGANTGGLPEIVNDGRNGLLYPPGDDIALAAQIRRMVEDPALYETFSRQGQVDVYAAFNQEKCLNKIEEILAQVIASNRHNT